MIRGFSKGQMMLEFMIFYMIVLVAFALLLVVVVNQRGLMVNSQDYSSMQLIAQNIAGSINLAVASGNGYSTSYALPQEIESKTYQLYITNTGVIIVNTTIGQQKVSAQGFSDAKQFLINGTKVYSSNSLIIYQVYSPSGKIEISNFDGIIYVNEQVPQFSNFISSLQLSTTPFGAATFNGNSATPQYFMAPSNGNYINNLTIAFWMYPRRIGNGYPGVSGVLTNGNYSEQIVSINYPNSMNSLSLYWQGNGGLGIHAVSSNGLIYNRNTILTTDNSLIFVTVTLNYGSSAIYVNGSEVYSQPTGVTTINAGMITSGNLIAFKPIKPTIYLSSNIAVSPTTNYTEFSGSISNLQIYNSSLSQSEIESLYNNGTYSRPINTAKLMGWWPFNLSAQDYSGYGNAGAILGNGSITSLALINAHAILSNGNIASDIPIGFISAQANTVNESSQVFTTKTGNNGNAIAIFSFKNFSGYDEVTAVPFYYETNYSKNIIFWSPGGYNDTPYVNSSNTSIFDLSGINLNAIKGVNVFNTAVRKPLNNSAESYSALLNTYQISSILQQQGFSANSIKTFSFFTWFNSSNDGILIDQQSNQISPAYHNSVIDLVKIGSTQKDNVYLKLFGSTCALIGNYTTNSLGGIGVEASVIGNSIEYSSFISQAIPNPNTSLIGGYYTFEKSGVLSINPSSLSSWNNIYYSLGGEDLNSCGTTYPTNASVLNFQYYNYSLSNSSINEMISQGAYSVPISSSGLRFWLPLEGNTNNYADTNITFNSVNITFKPTPILSFSSPAYYQRLNYPSYNSNLGTDYVDVPYKNSWNINNFTVSLLFSENNYTSKQFIYNLTQVSSAYTYSNTLYVFVPGNVIELPLQSSNLRSIIPQNISGVLLQNLVVTDNGSVCSVYLNGIESLSESVDCGSVGSGHIGNFIIGNMYQGIQGSVGDVMLLNTSINQNQVMQLYGSELRDGALNGPYAYYTQFSYGN